MPRVYSDEVGLSEDGAFASRCNQPSANEGQVR